MRLSTKPLDGEIASDQLESLAHLYTPALKRYFTRRNCQQATVDDLVQEVFVRLAGRVSGGEIDNPEAYIIRTASNVWRDFLRKRTTHAHTAHIEYIEDDHAVPDVSPADTYEGKETIHQLMEALRGLPPRTRQVFILCRYEGMKQKDVAKRLGVSKGCVSKQMLKAITYLAICFGGEK